MKMKDREFTRILAKYLVEGYMTPDDFERMTKDQIWCVHRIDLARAYLKRKQ